MKLKHRFIETLYKKFATLYSSLEDAYPCIGIDLCASGLTEDESSKSLTINQFFTKSKDTDAHHANGTTVGLKFNKQHDYTSRASFFENNKQANANEESETYECDKCNHSIPIVAIEEHSDYHFALDLLNQDKQQQPQQRPPQQRPPQQQKRKNTSTTEEEKKLKRSLFFQPKKNI